MVYLYSSCSPLSLVDVKITAPRPEHIKECTPVYTALPPPYQANDSDGEDQDQRNHSHSDDNNEELPEFSRSSISSSDFPADVKHLS